jgi:hypothetical protein
MDLTHIKSENGFFCRQKLLRIMRRMRGRKGEYHRLKKTSKSDFATIGIMVYGAAFTPLGQIYAGDRELYEFIKEEFFNFAKSMAFEAKADEWRPHDDDTN